MVKTKVVLNEQHQLMPNQVQVLNERYTEQGWEIYPVPANGWTLEEMEEIAHDLDHREVVFASPIPAVMKLLNARASNTWHVLHNDNREKKELPNGKIIMTVAKEGWQIV
jgi:hypothetical protein